MRRSSAKCVCVYERERVNRFPFCLPLNGASLVPRQIAQWLLFSPRFFVPSLYPFVPLCSTKVSTMFYFVAEISIVTEVFYVLFSISVSQRSSPFVLILLVEPSRKSFRLFNNFLPLLSYSSGFLHICFFACMHLNLKIADLNIKSKYTKKSNILFALKNKS